MRVQLERKLLVRLYDRKKYISLVIKAKRILKNISKKCLLNDNYGRVKKDFNRKWAGLRGCFDFYWLKIYGIVSGDWSPEYVPETIYYLHIEPRLNNKMFSKAYSDKNMYHYYVKDIMMPITLVRNVEGVFYEKYSNRPSEKGRVINVLESYNRFIIKPSIESGGGRNVALCVKYSDGYQMSGRHIKSVEEILNLYRKNYLIQEVIESHPFFAAFNPSSVNTVRFLIYRSVVDETVKILHSVFRVGITGSITDNQASGGYACGLTKEGCLTGRAVNKKGDIYDNVNGVRLEKGLKLLKYDEMIYEAKKIAYFFPYSRLMGIDLCVDKEGRIVLIEINNQNNEINFFQMLNGPLFGDYTDEVIKFCRSEKKSFVIDFTI